MNNTIKFRNLKNTQQNRNWSQVEDKLMSQNIENEKKYETNVERRYGQSRVPTYRVTREKKKLLLSKNNILPTTEDKWESSV